MRERAGELISFSQSCLRDNTASFDINIMAYNFRRRNLYCVYMYIFLTTFTRDITDTADLSSLNWIFDPSDFKDIEISVLLNPSV